MNEKVKHSPEPWYLDKDEWEKSSYYGISSARGRGGDPWHWFAKCVVKMEDSDVLEPVGVANAKRIVAAVNYCKGYSTEYLETHKHPNMLTAGLPYNKNTTSTEPKKLSIEDLKELMQATQELLMDYSIENQKNALYVLQVIKRGMRGE